MSVPSLYLIQGSSKAVQHSGGLAGNQADTHAVVCGTLLHVLAFRTSHTHLNTRVLSVSPRPIFVFSAIPAAPLIFISGVVVLVAGAWFVH